MFVQAGFGVCIVLITVFAPSMALKSDDEHIMGPEPEPVLHETALSKPLETVVIREAADPEEITPLLNSI